MEQGLRNWFDRWLARAEDPETRLDRYLDELQRDLVRLRQAVAQAIAVQKRTERQRDLARFEADRWYQRARQALACGNEALAREALVRRHPYWRNGEALGDRLQAQRATVSQLRTSMREFEERLAAAKAQRDLLAARARSAEAMHRLRSSLDGIGGGPAAIALERMEAIALEREATLALVRQSSSAAALEGGGDAGASASSFDATRSDLASIDDASIDDASIDAELARLKTQPPPAAAS